jgi:hypothetical protein
LQMQLLYNQSSSPQRPADPLRYYLLILPTR